jgi:hypothetical protein
MIISNVTNKNMTYYPIIFELDILYYIHNIFLLRLIITIESSIYNFVYIVYIPPNIVIYIYLDPNIS